MVYCLCPDTPPERVRTKGFRSTGMSKMIEKQNDPHVFALGLKDACCAEPCCCLLSFAGTLTCGATACWARKAVLKKYEQNGLDDYVCCQGYVPKLCCCDWPNCCQGSMVGLYLEGCCCPVFSLSMARIHLMDKKQIRPDPMDYQIIGCSNCLQLISWVLDIVAMFVEQARDLAHIVDCIADLFTLSVAGCMGAQISHEIKKDADGVVYAVAEGIPIAQGALPTEHAPPGSLAAQDTMGQPVVVAQPVGAPESEEMER
jgi:hypothetical protein|eukprot:Transcript_18171.p2 GENE.Transcript_18171~~Transcript_18171.p2  ORF type:complete len:258 (+),score=93.10 Transcript_18171:99-872(+)